MHRAAWTRHVGRFVGPPPRLRFSYCCVQLIVSRDLIRRRPRAMWESLLQELLDERSPRTCKISEHMLELSWAWLLGAQPQVEADCAERWGEGGAGGAANGSTLFGTYL